MTHADIDRLAARLSDLPALRGNEAEERRVAELIRLAHVGLTTKTIAEQMTDYYTSRLADLKGQLAARKPLTEIERHMPRNRNQRDMLTEEIRNIEAALRK